MYYILVISLFILSSTAYTFDKGSTYVLSESNMSYNVKYLLKDITGNSNKAKGLIKCGIKNCDGLIAVPVKSFTSKDSNRDLNMLTYTNASKFPLIKVSFKIELANDNTTGLSISFAGKQKLYKNILINSRKNKEYISMRTSFPIYLSDFEIDRPALLGISIKDIVPINAELKWLIKSK